MKLSRELAKQAVITKCRIKELKNKSDAELKPCL